jgi:hypothetical protein
MPLVSLAHVSQSPAYIAASSYQLTKTHLNPHRNSQPEKFIRFTMANNPTQLVPLPPVAGETFEQAATRLHSLLDAYLATARAQKEADNGFRPITLASDRKIDADEFDLRERLAETCRRVAALVVNPIEEVMIISYQVVFPKPRLTKLCDCNHRADLVKGCVVASMKAINDLKIPNLVPLTGDISIEELAEKTGAEPDFLGQTFRDPSKTKY